MILAVNVGRNLSPDAPGSRSVKRWPSAVVVQMTLEALRVLERDNNIRTMWHRQEPEDTYAARVELADGVPMWIIQHMLEGLAVELMQDCVAAVLTENGNHEGFLFGPRADKWAPFDMSKFLMLGA